MHLPQSSTLGLERPGASDPPECEIRTRLSWTVNSQVRGGGVELWGRCIRVERIVLSSLLYVSVPDPIPAPIPHPAPKVGHFPEAFQWL